MKRIIILLVSIFCAVHLRAQNDTTVVVSHEYSDIYLDTVNVSKQSVINDYSLVGVQFGPSFNQMMFNPTKKQTMLFRPVNFGITYTHYGKLFGIMPYFGYQVGLFYGQDGYKFKPNKEGEYTTHVDGVTKAVVSYVEVPALSHFHADIWKLKLIAEAGCYGAYKLSIEREGTAVMDKAYANKFHDYETRWDYGAKFGAGIGIMIDPLEFHIKAQYKWSWSTFYEPDYFSKYFYRFAYPMDLYISAGIHIQLTKRTGKTKASLRKEAYDIVYNNKKIEE